MVHNIVDVSRDPAESSGILRSSCKASALHRHLTMQDPTLSQRTAGSGRSLCCDVEAACDAATLACSISLKPGARFTGFVAMRTWNSSRPVNPSSTGHPSSTRTSSSFALRSRQFELIHNGVDGFAYVHHRRRGHRCDHGHHLCRPCRPLAETAPSPMGQQGHRDAGTEQNASHPV